MFKGMFVKMKQWGDIESRSLVFQVVLCLCRERMPVTHGCDLLEGQTVRDTTMKTQIRI